MTSVFRSMTSVVSPCRPCRHANTPDGHHHCSRNPVDDLALCGRCMQDMPHAVRKTAPTRFIPFAPVVLETCGGQGAPQPPRRNPNPFSGLLTDGKRNEMSKKPHQCEPRPPFPACFQVTHHEKHWKTKGFRLISLCSHHVLMCSCAHAERCRQRIPACMGASVLHNADISTPVPRKAALRKGAFHPERPPPKRGCARQPPNAMTGAWMGMEEEWRTKAIPPPSTLREPPAHRPLLASR